MTHSLKRWEPYVLENKGKATFFKLNKDHKDNRYYWIVDHSSYNNNKNRIILIIAIGLEDIKEYASLKKDEQLYEYMLNMFGRRSAANQRIVLFTFLDEDNKIIFFNNQGMNLCTIRAL